MKIQVSATDLRDELRDGLQYEGESRESLGGDSPRRHDVVHKGRT